MVARCRAREVYATCLDSQRLTSLGSFGPSECARQVMRPADGGRLGALVWYFTCVHRQVVFLLRSTSQSAFSMGPLGDHGARACYPQDGISEASIIEL